MGESKPIRVRNVGHVVLKVRDIERSARFYCDVLGLTEVARGEFGRRMAFFSTGDNHHDVAVMEMGPDAPAPPPDATGLYHIALRIGTTLDELRAARAHLEKHGITKLRLRDHEVSQSIYLDDPDGNMVELYVDADASTWRDKPETVATSRPLSL
jgi:catechol 2,3-dioxygenase